MTRRSVEVREFLMRLEWAAAKLERDVAFMEVCGTHTVNAFRCGLHSLMPPNVTLLSGPGCPVCVTAQGDVDQMIHLAGRPGVTLCTYGDMLRVTGSHSSLELERTRGADIRVIYSAMDAVKLAADEPRREVVLAAVGFETTAPATAIAVLEAHRRGLKNFSALVTHKLVLPAMRALLDGVPVKLDGFLCPGHVSVIIGAEVYRPIVEKYGKPCVIVGFEDLQLAAGLCRLVELALDGTPRLENLYPQAVSPRGNARALEVLERVFEPVEARWRGLAAIPASGLGLRAKWSQYDAARKFGLEAVDAPEPPGCRCGEVITGQCTPHDCTLFGTACTPVRPIGPCMVSSEGTCQAWFKYKRARTAKHEYVKT